MLLYDPETGYIIDANSSALDYYGWSLEEFRKKKIQQINTLSENSINEKVQNALNGNQKYFHFRHKRADGSIKDVEEYSGPIQTKDSQLLLSIIHDITDRVTAEQRLKASEIRARALIDASTEAVYLIDRNGNYLTMNDSLAQRMHKTKEELTGHSVFEFLSPELARARRDIIEEVLKKKQPIRYEDRMEGLVLDNNVFPILDDSDKVSQIAVFSRDITNEKSAKLATHISEEKYKFIANKTADVIFRLDLLTERYTYTSPSIEHIFGYNQVESLKLHARDILSADSYKQQRRRLQVAIREKRKEPVLMELDLVRKDGRTITAEINASLIYNDAGYPVGVLGIARDITKRKEAENEKERVIKDLQDAIQEIKTLSDLIPICSHCKNIRDDKGYWKSLEGYFEKHSNSKFSHSLCPDCAKELYGNEVWFDDLEK